MDNQKLGGYGIPMTGNILTGYQHYIKAQPNVIVPYNQEGYQFKESMQFKTDTSSLNTQSTLKVFDNNSLEFECKKLKMQDISKLDLSQSNITDEGIVALSSTENCNNISEINLSKNSNNISNLSLRYIASSQNLNKLENLILDDTSIDDYGIMFLTYPFTKAIELDTIYAIQRIRKQKNFESTWQFDSTKGGFTGSNLRTTQHTHASESQTMYSESYRLGLALNRLNKLSLQGLKITNKGLACITYSQNIKLTYLNLSFTRINDRGLIEYFQNPSSSFLEYLDVSNQPITDQSIQALTTSDFCRSIQTLKMQNCPLTDLSLKLLSCSQNSFKLTEIDITTYQKSQMTGEAIKLLCDASCLTNLQSLILDGQPFSQKSLLLLVNSPIMKNLSQLSCARNEDIDDILCTAIRDFYEKDPYKQLKYVNLMKTEITERGVQKLQDLVKFVHSIDNLKSMQKIRNFMKAGIKCYICEKCLMQQDSARRELKQEDKKLPINISMCFTCRSRPITTTEYPAKACYGCGKGFQEKICHLCQKSIGKHQLYRCHLCAIGYNKFKCFNCDKLIQT